MNHSYLDAFFNSKGLAMIGASANPDKWGFRILANIVAGGFKGLICPVNPKGGTLFGLKVYPSLKIVPDSVDLAIITIPAKQVSQALLECAEKGIRSVVVISSGFSEAGPEGRILEDELGRIAGQKDLHFIGPNTMGIFSAKTRLHALMPPIQPLSGGVSMVSQSGNVGVQMLGWGMERGVGFSKFISSGTEGNIHCEAYIDYLGSDPDTKVILAYLEGVKEGRLFFETARRTARKKPIILFKGGKTDVGSNAARSHSGAMAGSYTVFKAACHQAGFVEAETTDRLLDYAAVFLHYPLPKGNRIAILTRGGGWGVVAADACRQWGMELPLLSDRLIEKLNRILPPYWSHGNPVDMAATLNPEALPNCLEALIQEEGVDGIIVQGVESRQRSLLMAERLKEMNLLEDIDLGINKNETPEIQKLMEIAAAHQKPVLMVSPLSNITRSVSFGGQEAVIFSTPERAVRAMAKLCLYHSYLQRA